MRAAEVIIFAPADPTEEMHKMQSRFGGRSVWGVRPEPVLSPAR